MKPQLAFALAALLGSSALQAADAQLTVQINPLRRWSIKSLIQQAE